MRLPKLIITLFCIISTCALASRTDLHLFQYSIFNRDKTENHFVYFSDLLSAKLPKLSSELRVNQNLAEYGHLRLVLIKGDDEKLIKPNEVITSLADMDSYWINNNILAFLSGRVYIKNGTAFVKSDFFWGELRGEYPNTVISLELPLDGDAYDNTNDSHSIAILLALSNDLTGCNQRISRMKLLSEAHKKAQSLVSTQMVIGKKLLELVEKSIKEFKNECA